MTSKAGHTAGPAIIRNGYVVTDGAPFQKLAAIVTTNNDRETAQANAELIAEAFTVAHETGLTPRQLAEQIDVVEVQRDIAETHRDELLAALKGAEEWLSGWASAEPFLTTIRTAIAKAEGGAS